MNLSLCISVPEDSQGTGDSDSKPNPDYPDLYSQTESISRVLERELEELYPKSKSYEHGELSISIVTREDIRELNQQYRDVDEPTDVLSFPMLDDDMPILALGDIVICPEEVLRLHPELDSREAMCLMIAHSFLHLLGYDHDTEENQTLMWSRQDSLKARLLEVLE